MPVVIGISYATLGDFANFGLPNSVGTSMPTYTAVVTVQLEASSRFADTYIASRTSLPSPLVTWTTSLVQKVCEHAAYGVLKVRGFNPDDPSDAAVFKSYEAAVEWLQQIKEIQLTPDFVPVTPATAMASDPPRGWWDNSRPFPFEPID